MIVLNINLSKIPADKIIVGKKGKYIDVDICALKNGENEYGNTHYAYVRQSKEEREAGEPKVYVGDGKEIDFEKAKTPTTEQVEELDQSDESDELPF